MVITVDTSVLDRRERDVRRGFTMPPTIGPGTIVDGIRHPRWTYDLLCHEPITFSNILGREFDARTAIDLSAQVNPRFAPALPWGALTWLAGRGAGRVPTRG